MTKLSKNQKVALRQASRSATQQTFARLRRHFNRSRWIGRNNRYGKNCIETLRKDTNPGRTVNHNHLAQYIAASTILHCADGWIFLGNALGCHTKGDGNTARHLGYYAELRGAISLLATEGVGIFSRQHFVLENSNSCQKIPKTPGTHEITWLAFEHWADLRRSGDLLAEIITPGSIAFRDWLDGFEASVSVRPIASRWLKVWGLDLRRLSGDRDARNDASYRPGRLGPRALLDVNTSLSFLRDLWTMYEPSGPSRFENLDRHLLRLGLEEAYEAITGNSARADQQGFATRVETMLKSIMPSGPVRTEWLNFLMRRVEPDTPLLITTAKRASPASDPQHHMQVMARAVLLLRIATGACAWLLRRTGLGRTEIDFWWQLFGQDSGLWESGSIPAELTDLWADIESALEEAVRWGETNTLAQPSFARWWREQSYPISVLEGCERIALWGLGI